MSTWLKSHWKYIFAIIFVFSLMGLINITDALAIYPDSILGFKILPSITTSNNTEKQCTSPNPETVGEPITEWSIYEDPDYSFMVEYPSSWSYKTNIQQYLPYKNPDAIIKRQTFLGDGGMIDVDVWSSNGRNFDQWLEWFSKTNSPLPTTTSNAKISNNQAIVFLDTEGIIDTVTAYLNDGTYIYRFWYSVTKNQNGLQAYWHLVSTFRFAGKMVSTPMLPEGITEQAQNSIADSVLTGLLSTPCCGWNSGCDNYFPCCSDEGNCTWWVKYKYWEVGVCIPFRDDARTWWNQVPSYADWSRGSIPIRDHPNIAWWDASAGNDYGHVAFASNYDYPATNIYITEMFYCNSCFHDRSISPTAPNGWLYKPPD